MKIAQVVCVYSPYKGGIANVAEHYAGIEGLESIVFTPKYNDSMADEEGLIRLQPVLKFGNAALLPQLLYKLRDFDIVHLHYPFYGGSEFVLLAKILFGKKFKLIVHYHMDTTNLPLAKKIFTLPDILTFDLLLKKADAITCASIDYISTGRIAGFYQKNKKKFLELPFGVDIDRFKPIKKTIDGKGAFKILFLGGLDKAHYFKGLEVLFKSLAMIDLRKWCLDIVGYGDLKESYEQMALKLGISDKVCFLGKKTDDEIVECYQNSDLFILPSINSHEAFGIVLLEAMACGIPVIASRLRGVRTVFDDEKEGWYVEPGNADDLREKIIKAMEDEKRMEMMGMAARRLAEEKYDWTKIKNKLKKIYEDMLDK
jgi:glycosyltransferase involved in cell wall biosynthesis